MFLEFFNIIVYYFGILYGFIFILGADKETWLLVQVFLFYHGNIIENIKNFYFTKFTHIAPPSSKVPSDSLIFSFLDKAKS